jgi:hypothetical protein
MTRHVSRPLMWHGMYKSRPSEVLSFPRITNLRGNGVTWQFCKIPRLKCIHFLTRVPETSYRKAELFANHRTTYAIKYVRDANRIVLKPLILTGYFIYHQDLTLNNSTLSREHIHMLFMVFRRKKYFLDRINFTAFIRVTECVYCSVRTASLNVIKGLGFVSPCIITQSNTGSSRKTW